MGSAESHFYISLVVRDIVTRQCPLRPQLLKRKAKRIRTEAPLSAYQPNTLPLGQTGSHFFGHTHSYIIIYNLVQHIIMCTHPCIKRSLISTTQLIGKRAKTNAFVLACFPINRRVSNLSNIGRARLWAFPLEYRDDTVSHYTPAGQ